ncbi:hypothetical protein ACOJBO_12115 [Rhizobium beringeri]
MEEHHPVGLKILQADRARSNFVIISVPFEVGKVDVGIAAAIKLPSEIFQRETVSGSTAGCQLTADEIFGTKPIEYSGSTVSKLGPMKHRDLVIARLIARELHAHQNLKRPALIDAAMDIVFLQRAECR